MSNVADSDVLLGSVPFFLSFLSANGSTARPFGTTLQAVNLSGLHRVTRVPFFSSDIVSASIPSSLAPFASLRSVARPSCFRKPIATGIPYLVAIYPFSSSHGCWLRHRVVYLAMRHFASLLRGVGESITSFSFVSNSRIFDPLSNSGCFVDIL